MQCKPILKMTVTSKSEVAPIILATCSAPYALPALHSSAEESQSARLQYLAGFERNRRAEFMDSKELRLFSHRDCRRKHDGNDGLA
jgi:hypothetical protein